ncbi:MAG: flavin reductase family protein, partial [Euryarchaeota archaeon CG_4_9_14_3_um_filter_38_12]
MYGISMDPKRYSHNLIMDSKEFVVNFAPFSIVDKLHYCGRHSGRNVDKFRETGLTPVPAEKVNAPLIKECYSHLECRLAET